jgi:transposase
MPWKERSIVEERMRFVLRLKDGETMASLCREFGISRVTGYKIYERYKECGLEGLTDRARTPYRYANKLPAQLETMIVAMRREKPTWGARKLRERLLRKLPNDIRVPACSTIHAILELSYPFHDRTVLVTCCGRTCIFKKKINLSTSLAGQAVGIKEVDDGIWLVSFMDYDLGYIDLEEKTLQPLENPFGPRV